MCYSCCNSLQYFRQLRHIVKNEVDEKDRLPHQRPPVGPIESRDAHFVDEKYWLPNRCDPSRKEHHLTQEVRRTLMRQPVFFVCLG